MAELLLGNIKPAGADNIVVDSRYVKGGYVVVTTIAERNALKGANGENIVNGSLCYCTADSTFYQYNKPNWLSVDIINKVYTADGDSINLAGYNFSINGYADASNDTIPKKTSSGLTWVAPSAIAPTYTNGTNINISNNQISTSDTPTFTSVKIGSATISCQGNKITFSFS